MKNRIGLRQLRAFQAVMITGSVTLAAERLNLTQPAISKQLTALEAALDIKLFSRKSGSAMIPTRDGVAYFKAIEATLSGVEKLYDIAQEISSVHRRRISIAGTPPLMNSAPIAEAMREFLQENRDIHLSLELRHSLEIEDWVASRQIDFALALLPVANPMLTSIAMVETRAVAVVSNRHRFASRKSIGLEDLADVTTILPSRQPLRNRIDRAMELNRRDLRVDIEASSAITCCRMAVADLGVAICDPFSPTAFSPQDLHVLELSPAVALTYGAVISKDAELSSTATAFLERVKASLNAMSAV